MQNNWLLRARVPKEALEDGSQSRLRAAGRAQESFRQLNNSIFLYNLVVYIFGCILYNFGCKQYLYVTLYLKNHRSNERAVLQNHTCGRVKVFGPSINHGGPPNKHHRSFQGMQ